jgi:DNA-binding NarL/FixJ family response regulator
VILTSYLSDETVRNALQAGAATYVTKAARIPRLTEVLEEVRDDPDRRVPVHGAPQLVRELDRVVGERQGPVRITQRQERILELAAEGLTNQAISARLFISESTVRFHLQGLKERLGARTRAELVGKAIRLGVIAPAPDDAGAM